ncbi:hypothetical protein C2G38_2186333 [Gigaspora rosea]|uniref:Uncharacterized protein n=1 Tax=Gigaspora rosea TaxID=44941 RepID=A0A397VEQ6_9GLOM|nr:hypothetical protein C2G38_2186333 [Gigaspora rosea]
MILDLIGQLKIEEVTIIKVCLVDGIFYLLDNKRLYTFQSAIKLKLKVKKIPVKIVRVENSNLVWKLDGSKIIIQNTNFFSTVMSEYARNNVVIDQKGGFWEHRQ